MQKLYLAGGCFWGTQHFLRRFDGVLQTTVGYANGHTETVEVLYDETVLPTRQLLDYYFMTIDPLSVNRQGEDEGENYRTGIYYEDPALLPDILAVTEAKAQQLGQPLAVEVGPLLQFFPAEDYHQDYLIKHPTGYCHISPKLMRLARAKKEEGQ